MGHSTVSCAKTAELQIEMLFWTKTRLGPKKQVLDRGADPQGKDAIFGGCPGHSKALAIIALCRLLDYCDNYWHNGSVA